MKPDKLLHFAGSLILVSAIEMFIIFWLAALITLGIGILKELYDKFIKKTGFSYGDIFANVCGILVGILIIILEG